MPTPQDLKECLRRDGNFSGEVFYNRDLETETLVLTDENHLILASYDLEDVVRFIAKSNVRTLEDDAVDTVVFAFDITKTEAYETLFDLEFEQDAFYRRSVKTNEQSILYALTYVQRLTRKFSKVQWNYVYVELVAALENVQLRLDGFSAQQADLILTSSLTSSKETLKEVDTDFFQVKAHLSQEQKNLLVTLWLIGFAILDTNRFCISKVGQDKKHPCYELMMSDPTSPAFNAYIESTLSTK